LNEEIEELILKAEKIIEKGVPFEFWKLLGEAEQAAASIGEKISGEVEGGVIVKGKLCLGKGSIVKAGSRIEGNVFIGKNCVIGPNAFLRSGAIICGNCRIGTSEIKNSLILSGSNVPHYSYIGDSIIGKNCNLGAGTKIANLRHDNMNIKVKIGGEKIDSGRRKLGALLFSGVKTGVNSSINCGAIIPSNSKILPNEFRK